MRQELRRCKKKVILENRGVLNTEYNRYTNTNLIGRAIKAYTEEKCAKFLGKLGPHPSSSSSFWKIINRARSPKKNSNIPNLVVGTKDYKSDKEKAELIRASLGLTFTEESPSSNFDAIFYNYIMNFV